MEETLKLEPRLKSRPEQSRSLDPARISKIKSNKEWVSELCELTILILEEDKTLLKSHFSEQNPLY